MVSAPFFFPRHSDHSNSSQRHSLTNNCVASYSFTLVTRQASIESTVLKQYVTPLETPLSKFSTLLLGYLFDLLVAKLHYTAMNLHDPLCIGFFLDLEHEADITKLGWHVEERDIRIETEGTLTRGMIVVDRRVKATKDAPGSVSRANVVLKTDPERYVASMLYDIWGVTNYPGDSSSSSQ